MAKRQAPRNEIRSSILEEIGGRRSRIAEAAPPAAPPDVLQDSNTDIPPYSNTDVLPDIRSDGHTVILHDSNTAILPDTQPDSNTAILPDGHPASNVAATASSQTPSRKGRLKTSQTAVLPDAQVDANMSSHHASNIVSNIAGHTSADTPAREGEGILSGPIADRMRAARKAGRPQVPPVGRSSRRQKAQEPFERHAQELRETSAKAFTYRIPEGFDRWMRRYLLRHENDRLNKQDIVVEALCMFVATAEEEEGFIDIDAPV